jgi:hypothetical protein
MALAIWTILLIYGVTYFARDVGEDEPGLIKLMEQLRWAMLGVWAIGVVAIAAVYRAVDSSDATQR